MVRCRNLNNIYYVGMYLFCLPKHIATVTAITVQFYVYQQQHPKTPNSCYLKSVNTKRQRNTRGSADRGELDLNSDVNLPASGKLRKYTSVSSQCERLSYPWMWRFMYFMTENTRKILILNLWEKQWYMTFNIKHIKNKTIIVVKYTTVKYDHFFVHSRK